MTDKQALENNENLRTDALTSAAQVKQPIIDAKACQHGINDNSHIKDEDILYHKLQPILGRSADIPRNRKNELFLLPLPSGEKIMFDVTAMNEYWNSVPWDYNAYTDLCPEPVKEWFDHGEIWEGRLKRFMKVLKTHQSKGIVTRLRPLLAVVIDGDIQIVDGRHRYALMLASNSDALSDGRVPCLPTYVFREDEWKQFVVTDERIKMKLTANGS
jgi:hypothetical protein